MYPTLRERIEQVTLEEVLDAGAVALKPSNRTVGWFEPTV